MLPLESALERLDPARPLGALLLAVVLLVAGILFSWLVRRALAALLTHDRSDRLNQITLSFLSHLLVLVIWLLLLTLYAHLVPALSRLGTALLAGVSLVSVIVGFGAQATLGNLVSGISLVLYKPFGRGDRLQVAVPGENGWTVATVQDISLGYTLLRMDDGRQIVVANGTMAQQTMVKLPPAPH